MLECTADIAIDVERGQLEALLAPLARNSVTTIVGFTETVGAGKLYNSAAMFATEGSPASTASAILRSRALCTVQGTKARSSPSALSRSGS